ncbi:hypothetical protein ACF0H5_001728 [Mactra antiquata]
MDKGPQLLNVTGKLKSMSGDDQNISKTGISGFYGAKNKRKWIGLERAIESVVERHQQLKIPKQFPSRILGPPVTWKIFHRQQDAFNYSRSKSKDLHVFAFEKETFEKNTGQRLYLVASYPVFYHYYIQLDSHRRVHYEVIPEGAVCKLYFDLEYDKTYNPQCDGNEMMKIFIKYVCLWIYDVYKIKCNRENILDLDASTEKKFSRHLIFQLKNSCFRNNIHAGRFVLHIMSALLQKVKSSNEGKTDNAYNNHEVNDNNEEKVDHTDCVDTARVDNCNQKTSFNQFKYTIKTDIHAGVAQLEELEKPTMIIDDEVRSNTTTLSGVLDQFSVDDLKKLIVKNKHNEDVLFSDTGVYTKNRNFRLFLSSKLGKNNPLTISEDNTYRPTQWIGDELKFNFFASLVANIEYTSHLKILTFGDDKNDTQLSSTLSGLREKSNKGAESLIGFNKSPYPEVDEYITSIITENSAKGVIRQWTYFHQGELLLYEIARYRYCHNIGRHHRSNNIMLIVDLHKGVYYQKCHDPECTRLNYKSPEWPLPIHILPCNYFDDENDGFDDDNDTIGDDNDKEMNDEELLNTTLEIEKRLQQNSECSEFDDEIEDDLLISAVDQYDKKVNVSMATNENTNDDNDIVTMENG